MSDQLTSFTDSEYNPPMAKRIDTIEGLVQALGGTGRVASMVGVDAPAVSNWMARGYIPPGHHLTLTLEAWVRGLDIDPKIFGLIDAHARVFRCVLRSPGKRPSLIPLAV